jgi:hypothetical protein
MANTMFNFMKFIGNLNDFQSYVYLLKRQLQLEEVRPQNWTAAQLKDLSYLVKALEGLNEAVDELGHLSFSPTGMDIS